MSLTRWQQRAEVGQWPGLSEPGAGMDWLFNGPNEHAQVFGGWTPPVDLYEAKDDFIVRMEVPGLTKEALDVSLLDGTITISGERKSDDPPASDETARTERMLGRFQRSITLPVDVEPDKVNATYRNGILLVKMGKAETAKPRQISVKMD